MISFNQRVSRGYTLLELMVSVGLFSLVMLIVLSAYLTLVHLDRKARATTDVMTNISFVAESMSREIRTGSSYQCSTNGSTWTPNCSSPGVAFRFVDSRATPRTVTYSRSNNQVYITITVGGNTTTSALTDPRVIVNKLDFYVRGVGTGDTIPPQVTFVMQGAITPEPNVIVDFSLQGSATQRLLELI